MAVLTAQQLKALKMPLTEAQIKEIKAAERGVPVRVTAPTPISEEQVRQQVIDSELGRLNEEIGVVQTRLDNYRSEVERLKEETRKTNISTSDAQDKINDKIYTWTVYLNSLGEGKKYVQEGYTASSIIRAAKEEKAYEKEALERADVAIRTREEAQEVVATPTATQAEKLTALQRLKAIAVSVKGAERYDVEMKRVLGEAAEEVYAPMLDNSSILDTSSRITTAVSAVDASVTGINESSILTQNVIGIWKEPSAEELAKAEVLRKRQLPWYEKAIEERKEVQKFFRIGTLPVTTELTKAYEKVYYGFRPEEKVAEKRIEDLKKEIEKGIKKHEGQVVEFNRDVKTYQKKEQDFIKKYSGKELSQKEYDMAATQQEKLITESQELTQRGRELTDEEIAFEREVTAFPTVAERWRKKAKDIPFVRDIGSSLALGFITAPLVALSLPLTAAIEPEKIVSGIAGLPQRVMAEPQRVIPEAIGGAVFYTAALTLIRAAVSPAKPRIAKTSQSISISKAIKIRKVGKKTLWSAEAKIKTKWIDPKTNKVIRVVDTQVKEIVVTSTTKEGAMKAAIRAIATDVKMEGARFGISPKAQFKLTATGAKGEVTLTKTQVAKLYEARGTYQIGEIARGRATVDIITGKLTGKLKIRKAFEPEYLARQDAWIRQIGKPRLVEIPIGVDRTLLALKTKYHVAAWTDLFKAAKIKPSIRGLTYKPEFKYAEGKFISTGKIAGLEYTYVPLKFKWTPKDIISPLKKVDVTPTITKTRQLLTMDGIPKPVQIITIKPVPPVKGIPAKLVEPFVEAVVKPTTTLISQKIIAVPRIIPAVRVTPAVIPSLRERTREEERQIERMVGAVRTVELGRVQEIQLEKIFQTTIVAPTQMVSPVQKLRQLQLLQPIQIQPPAFVPPVIPPVIAPPFIPPFVPPPITLEQRQYERKRRKAVKIRDKQAKKYAASVAAVMLDITIPKVPKPRKYTGLEIRPMVRRKKKKKKKKDNYIRRLNKVLSL